MVGEKSDRLFNWSVNSILLVVGFISLFPLLFVFSMSITPYVEVLKQGGFIIIPRSITFEAYKMIFTETAVPRALLVTTFVTVVGTSISLLLSVLLAYPLSRRQLKGKVVFSFLVVFTMLFNGGIIPTYLVVHATGLLDTVWAMIIPNAIAPFNVLILLAFFRALPEELFEAAKIDGAGDGKILGRIVLPLSNPVLMTVGLFYMVMRWNEYLQGVLYISSASLRPLQVVIHAMLLNQTSLPEMNDLLPTRTVQMAAVITASLPIIVVYPFLQKYLIKGMLIGAIKG